MSGKQVRKMVKAGYFIITAAEIFEEKFILCLEIVSFQSATDCQVDE